MSLPGKSQGWGAWWSAIYGAPQSQTRLKRHSSRSSIPKLYKCKFMITSMLSYRFCIFILSYLLSFFCSLHICRFWAISSLITSSISISLGQNRQRDLWGESKKKELWGHEWRMVALVTHHECSVVGSHSPALLWTQHPRFAMTMEDTFASGIWVELISHFQMEILFSVPQAGVQI